MARRGLAAAIVTIGCGSSTSPAAPVRPVSDPMADEARALSDAVADETPSSVDGAAQCAATGDAACFGETVGPARCGTTLVPAKATCCCPSSDLACMMACGRGRPLVAPSWLHPAPREEIVDCEVRCAAGHAPSCTRAAQSYVPGQGGVGRDLSRALDLQVRACEIGHAEGCEQLQRMFVLHGTCAHRAAWRWVLGACDGGDPAACRVAAACEELTHGMRTKAAEAFLVRADALEAH